MHLSRAKQTIIREAEAAGWRVSEEWEGIHFRKYNAMRLLEHWCLNSYGTFHNMMLRPEFAEGIRTHARMRECLGLEKEKI